MSALLLDAGGHAPRLREVAAMMTMAVIFVMMAMMVMMRVGVPPRAVMM